MTRHNAMPTDPAYLEGRKALKSLAGWEEDEDFLDEEADSENTAVEADDRVGDLPAMHSAENIESWPEKTLRELIEALPDAMVVISSQGTIVLVNAQTERVLGYPRAELLDRKIEKLIPQRFQVGHVGKRDAYFTHPKSRPMGAQLDLFGKRKDGTEFPVEISLSPLFTEQGVYATGVIREISQRKREEAKFKTLVENIPAVTFFAPLDESVPEIYVSPQIVKLLGFTPKEWREDPVLWYRQLHPQDRVRWNRQFAPTCASGKPFQEIYRFIAKDGRVVWVHGSANVVRDTDGTPSFLQGVAFDITQIKEAEEERDRFFLLSIDMLCVAGLDGYFKRINPAFIHTLGFSEQELLSSPFIDFVHPEHRAATMAEVARLASGRITINFENRLRCKDGSYKWLQWVATPYLDQKVMYAAARDISDQKRDEESLLEQARLALLRADVSSAITQTDSLPGMLQRCAVALTEHLEVAFARVWTFNEQEQMLKLQASAGIYTHLDGPHGRVRLGKFKIGLIAARRQPLCTNEVVGDERIDDQAWALREGMVAFAGYPLLIENRLVGVLGMFSRRRFSQAALQTLELVAAQVSLGIERMWTEEALRRSNEELDRRVKERTEELEHFAYVASHDLTEPLRSLKNYPVKLADKYGGRIDQKFDDLINQTILGAKRLEQLITHLLQYSRVVRRDRVRKPTDAGESCGDACNNLQAAIEESGAQLTRGELPTVMGNHEDLVILFQNLIHNAVKFRDRDRPIRVEVGARREQDDWLFWVHDNGIGIESRFIETKLFRQGVEGRLNSLSKYPGNGYGLHNCKKIVTGHGGRIWVESEFGKGSTFYFTLPAVYDEDRGATSEQ
jgi:PAS domain S-box-containing protein